MAASAPGDFNGDGYSDLAIGVPNEGVPNFGDNGAVNVLYGGVSRLSAAGNQLWRQISGDSDGENPDPAHFGYAVATGDFNGDGFADLAVGAPGSDAGTEPDHKTDVGVVNVIYGGPDGLSAAGIQFWHQDVAGIEGEAQGGDAFGSALATGDFDGDGFADLAVGVPHDWTGTTWTGAVNVIYGGPTGLSAAGNQLWHQDVEGVPDDGESADDFGAALAAGDFDDDGFADLGIGVPGEDLGTGRNEGAINVLYAAASGLSAERGQFWHQDGRLIGGSAENGDRFGSSLAAANFGNGLAADLAVGVPEEDFGSIDNAGAVNVFYGREAEGFSLAGEFWQQNTDGIVGDSETGDQFGFALAAANFGKGRRADLAVGVPGEDVGSRTGGGAVNVIYAGHAGLTTAGNERWHQDRPRILDEVNGGDAFGYALAAADFGGNSWADLAVGVPGENVGAAENAGAVNVLYGGEHGFSAAGNQFWHQNRPGIRGEAERHDVFGLALAPPV